MGKGLKYLFFLFFSGIFIFGCSDNPKPKKQKKVSFTLVEMPIVDADSVYSFVQKQVDFGPRIPNSIAHERCADWMVRKFKRFG